MGWHRVPWFFLSIATPAKSWGSATTDGFWRHEPDILLSKQQISRADSLVHNQIDFTSLHPVPMEDAEYMDLAMFLSLSNLAIGMRWSLSCEVFRGQFCGKSDNHFRFPRLDMWMTCQWGSWLIPKKNWSNCLKGLRVEGGPLTTPLHVFSK